VDADQPTQGRHIVSEISKGFEQRRSEWSDIQDHLWFLHDAVMEEGARVVVELGTRDGNSTSAFLTALESNKGKGHLWSIDITPVNAPAAWWRSGLWTFIFGDDLKVRDHVPDDIDILFIDTSHYYDHTLSELRLYGPRSKTILLHDVDLEEPWGKPRKDPKFPVRAAIGTWIAEAEHRTVEYLEGSHGLGVIR